MFPNPQDALPLRAHPTAARYQRLAEQLVEACASRKEDALRDWSEKWIEGLARRAGWNAAETGRLTREVEDFARRTVKERGRRVSAARFAIARCHGFADWRRFCHHLEGLAEKGSGVWRFEAAAEAIVNGDVAGLRRLLRDDSKLGRAKSAREHGATLLHYVSANGVENYRQRTPPNIAAIAEMLLRAGADVDATADVYGAECTALGLAATSCYPERAGVQEALLEALLNHRASLRRRKMAGSRRSVVDACLANGRLKAAEFLARRGAAVNLAGAAGLGWLDVVKGFFAADGSPRKPSKAALERAFLNACAFGHSAVVELLLDMGVKVDAKDVDRQTGLHQAVIGGHLETVKLLLRRGAPLETRNVYGGTILGQTLWSAAHGGETNTYLGILETLAAAGARIPERHVPVNCEVDAWLERHGSRAESTWHWFGEEPRGKAARP